MPKYDQAEVYEFVDKFINNGFDALSAMREMNPHLSDVALGVKKSRWIHSDTVQRAILEQLHEIGANKHTLKNLFNKVLLMIINDSSDPKDRISAILASAKLNDMLKDKLDVTQHTISPEQQEIIHNRLQALGLDDAE